MAASHLQLFDELDRMDPDAFARHLAPDVVMRFANEAPVYGRDACRERAVSLFTSMAGLSHHVVERWAHGDATIVEASVTFTLPDHSEVVVPMVTIYRTAARGLIADYRVYLDPSQLWPTAG
jgi:ketosteroid isomerase-like protein